MCVSFGTDCINTHGRIEKSYCPQRESKGWRSWILIPTLITGQIKKLSKQQNAPATINVYKHL